jgi:hypothetical protein
MENLYCYRKLLNLRTKLFEMYTKFYTGSLSNIKNFGSSIFYTIFGLSNIKNLDHQFFTECLVYLILMS